MRAVAVASAVVVLAIGAAGAAAGANERDARIRPGVGIGPVSLGMTYTQVRRALGRPGLVNRRQGRGFGTRYIEYLWNWGEWRVGLLGRPGRERVVRVATNLRRERTPEGIGVGSTARQMARAYGRRAVCVSRYYDAPDAGMWIVLRSGRSRMTAFWLYTPRQDYGEPRQRTHVGEVLVQHAWITPIAGQCTWDWTRQ